MQGKKCQKCYKEDSRKYGRTLQYSPEDLFLVNLNLQHECSWCIEDTENNISPEKALGDAISLEKELEELNISEKESKEMATHETTPPTRGEEDN